MVNEVVILPEMLAAGAEAVNESREHGLNDVDTAIAVFLSMSAVFEMARVREANETRH